MRVGSWGALEKSPLGRNKLILIEFEIQCA